MGGSQAHTDTIVYTVIVGGYDVPQAVWPVPGIDWRLVSETGDSVAGWAGVQLPPDVRQMSGSFAARWAKMHATELFGERPTLYIDGSARFDPAQVPGWLAALPTGPAVVVIDHPARSCLYCEARRIAARRLDSGAVSLAREYEAAGYPREGGLVMGGWIWRDGSPPVAAWCRDWWAEYRRSGMMRDQLSLAYTLWQSGVDYATIGRPLTLSWGRHVAGEVSTDA